MEVGGGGGELQGLNTTDQLCLVRLRRAGYQFEFFTVCVCVCVCV